MSDKTKPEGKPASVADFPVENEFMEPAAEGVMPDATVESAEVLELRAQLEKAQAEAKKNWEKVLRTEADLQNVQRRAAIDVDNARKFGTDRMAQELLAVVDSFEQGLKYEQDDSLRDGMKLTYSMLLEVLGKFGIKEINPPVAAPFDPHSQEAICLQDSADMDANCIISVVQKGYFIHERILRAARVIVSRLPADAPQE